MYFKITMPKKDEMLPMYTKIDGPMDQSLAVRKAAALKRVERLTGPLRGAKIEEIQQSDIPEGEDLV